MIETIKEKTVGKNCTVELTVSDGKFAVRGFYGDCINYNFEIFSTYDEAEAFYNKLDSVKKCKAFYGM